MTPTAHPKKTVILTHGDVDGVCAAAIAKASYPEAEVEFTDPADLASKLDSLSGHDRVIVLDLGIDSAQKDKVMTAFQKLSKTSSIIYIDHHPRPPEVTERSLACSGAHRAGASTSELAWEFFKPAASHDFIAVLGAIGDYREKTPRMQGLTEKYDERKVYPEALFLEWALMVAEDPFKRGVVEELAQGKWPYQMSIMGRDADSIVRRQRTLERYVREKAEKICERVMLVRDPPFNATGPAAALLTNLDNTDIGIASRREGGGVYLSMRRHRESDINLASLIEKSALKFGGVGGGHKEAAGGKIPVEMFDEFLLEIGRRLPEGQVKRIKVDVRSVDKKTIEHKLFKEIIERKRAEEMVKESEEKYRIQFEGALDAIFVADAETGEIIDCNRAALQLVGREKSEIIGQHQKILHPPEEIEGEFSRTFKLHLKDKAGQVLEAQVITKKGEIRDVSIKANIFELSGRKMIQGIFRDITERKRADETLRESEKKFRGLYSAMNEGLCLHEIIYGESGEAVDYRIIDVNPAYESILGIKREKAVGSKASELYGTGEPPYLEIYAKVAASGEPTSFETFFPPMEKHFVISVFSPGKGKFATIFFDITERKNAEKMIRESTYKVNGISPGECYLHSSHDAAYRIFSQLVLHGVPGLCISREKPEKLMEYGVPRENIILLSSMPLKGFEAIENLQDVSRTISNFLEKHETPVVLLDGLAYLISRFDFNPVYKFVQEKRFNFIEVGATLLISIDLATLTDKERALLTSEVKVLG